MSVEGILAHRREIKSASERSAARDLLTIPSPLPSPRLSFITRAGVIKFSTPLSGIAGEIKHVCKQRERCCIQESGLADRDNDTDPTPPTKGSPGRGKGERKGKPRDSESRRLFRRIFSRTVGSGVALPPPPRALVGFSTSSPLASPSGFRYYNT